ncbi:Cytochrome P450 family protein [Phaeobacter gallaeciensis]|uniref:Cytochrome P450 n=1 Tax=Phaeobacter gallaeciensis TaxID=60890 RepID=A0A1B0ZN35_9RHOB|nr:MULTISPECIES: cytochrome P450 [Phaeobacter]MDF1773884.1 cytochrome P450 [Pseudophaeobacter sp. bin_em_oilr2.035]MEE2634776.1 cytochrome P450 [Pseudomonadota bacterium]ANP35560.1 Cytochrome P450 family protein [Phaeobacter gallaeciensis]MDE4063720.1 cytochrome P450 [Phaeobacter gallaeciensis]MDE4126745.1 cytochrome P450 [Phaeobacter gallaeciensis]
MAFSVVDLPGYYRNMADLAGLELNALIRVIDSIPFFSNGPRHLLLRRVILQVLREDRIDAWQPIVDEEVDTAISRLGNSAVVDLVEDFADPLFARVMTRLFGLPRDQADNLNRWAETVRFVSELLLPIRRVRQMNDAADQLLEAIRSKDARTRRLRDTSIASMLERAAGTDLTAEEVDALIAGLFIAGQTTAHTLSNILLLVLRLDPEQRPLPTDPAPRRNAVEDLIRRGGAPQYLLRIAREDKTVGGHDLEVGDPVLVHIPSANRLTDGAGIPPATTGGCPFGQAPDVKPHFSFGAGIHHCPGAPLARMLIDTALHKLLNAFPEIELLDPEPEMFGTDIIKSPRSLSSRLTATAS